MPITDCNATVPAHRKGVLQNDVFCGWYCSGDVSIRCDGEYDDSCNGNGSCTNGGIVLERGSVLDLNGHDLTGSYDLIAIFCDDGPGRCVVKGPGRITGGDRGIYSWAKDVVVKDVTISAQFAAVQTGGRLMMSNTDLTGDFELGAEGHRGVQLKNVRVGSAQISTRGDIDLQNVTIGPSGEVVAYYGTIRGRDVVLTGNADVLGRHVALRRATSAPDANGITDTWVDARRRLSLVDSNAVQIVSGKAPRLVESTCERSFVAASLGTDTWKVCSGD